MTLWALMLFLGLTPVSSWARGGGGCLAEGTAVFTPQGAMAIEKLKPGDPVWSVFAGRLQPAAVRALRSVEPSALLKMVASGSTLTVTEEHPIMTAPGLYRQAGWLQRGDRVYLAEQGRLRPAEIQSIRRIEGGPRAFNLLVSPGGTFIAEGVVVHNKGCFFPDSPILKGDGQEAPISALRPGDELLAFTPDGRMVRTRVREIMSHQVDELVVLKTDRTTLRTTLDHPFYTGRGTFKTVEALRQGDTLKAWDGRWFSEQRIVSLQRVKGPAQVFNLQTDQPNTFFAGRLAVHNKGGGCFPAGTTIAAPNGPLAIESLHFGDEVLAVRDNGQTVRTRVQTIWVRRSPLLRIETGRGTLLATEEHPVGLWNGGFRPAGDLRPGERIIRWKGGRLVAGKVRAITPEKNDALVFNLQVGEPHTFLAEGLLVHNKGGGSSRSGSSSRSRSGSSSGGGGEISWTAFLLIMGGMILGFILLISLLSKIGKSKTENLDFVYRPAQIMPKAEKTMALLTFLSGQDPAVSPEDLRKLAESTFRKLQECWESREYGPMKPLLMADLFDQHLNQLQGLRRNHEINRIRQLTVERLDLVNIRYMDTPAQREFTALFTASAQDYYEDDRTGKFLRGDTGPARFQEFWTFQRWEDRWLLREIEQAGESDILKDENFAEMLTDDTLKGIYLDAARGKGDAGPWLEKQTEEKATRIERLLNFLAQTDKLWDRRSMLERARKLFLSVYLARESGDPARIPAPDLFPGLAADLRLQLERGRTKGFKVEYRNLCVRKAELILVRNFADQAQDEFTVRISAHAQMITYQGEQVAGRQPYVTPFEEYWTFGRLDNQWKLKEVLPPGRGKKKIQEENLDEDSSPGQLQWYYQQSRVR